MSLLTRPCCTLLFCHCFPLPLGTLTQPVCPSFVFPKVTSSTVAERCPVAVTPRAPSRAGTACLLRVSYRCYCHLSTAGRVMLPDPFTAPFKSHYSFNYGLSYTHRRMFTAFFDQFIEIYGRIRGPSLPFTMSLWGTSV